MSLLALTRAGVASAAHELGPSPNLWVGADVLSDVEVQMLRAAGLEISVFDYRVRTADVVARAIATVVEHHPNEPVWVESLPDAPNPRSSELAQAFLWREYIVGVDYRHNDSVVVVAGPHAGERGSLVSLLGLLPEPEFTLEAESGLDVQVRQSDLVLSRPG